MRLNAGLCQKYLGALAMAAAALAYAAPASAGMRHHDHVYADSFGNLVIDSAAGYKRILVGEGRLAKELSAYVGDDRPKVEYLDRSAAVYGGDCYRPPVFVKGRSYMYGLSDGEMPDLNPCC